MINLTSQQAEQLQKKGIPEGEVFRQLSRFATGMLYVELDRAATEGDGILVFNEAEKGRYVSVFDAACRDLELIKFVPASGAATRMFKELFEFLDMSVGETTTYESLPQGVRDFGLNLQRMPFVDHLCDMAGIKCNGIPDPFTLQSLVKVLLLEDGLNYGSLPKALLTFHNYVDHVRHAFEEHLVEWGTMLNTSKKDLKIHFTLSPNHIALFRKALDQKLPVYQERFLCDFLISYSVQEGSTDTVAANEDNLPFTSPDGLLLFRPGGHGALLYNLNQLDADIILIKNIDNVAVENIETQNVDWKKILTGLLVETKTGVDAILTRIERGEATEAELQESVDWIRKRFNHRIDHQGEALKRELFTYLNRPIRVCGMVKNTGEPGGGPFWVNSGGDLSLQIIESAQIDHQNPDQHAIARSATHFNPVDLVCGVRDYKGNKFDLNQFSDPDTSFISVKSHQGKVLKALEHPGLWNGAMAGWLTLFVEVPLMTFNPVKTVNDLLRPEHQNDTNDKLITFNH
jgi:hypothetical protein